MNTHDQLFSFAKNKDISLAQFYNNSSPDENFMLPVSLEARTEMNDLQAMMTGISLESMATDEWILCWGHTRYKPKKYKI